MPAINPHLRPQNNKLQSRKPKLLKYIAVVICVLLLANVVCVVLYHGKALPNTKLGQTDISNMSSGQLQMLPKTSGLQDTTTLTHSAQKAELRTQELGISVDKVATLQKVKSHWLHWVPLLSFVKSTTIPVVLHINEAQFNAAIQKITPTFELAPQDIHIAFNGQKFVQAPASDGYSINKSATERRILAAIALGSKTAQIATSVTKAPPHNSNLSADITRLNKEVATLVSFAVYGGEKTTPTLTDKAAWYVQNGQTMSFSREKVGIYLDKIAAKQKITLLNRTDLTTAAFYALSHQQTLDFRMIKQGNEKRTYCTAVRGVAVSELTELNDKLAAVYADARGWSDDGRLGFEHVDSGCNYTVWLSAANQMTTFGAICDDYYNCQVGNSVVVNNDRWMSATVPWNQTGGSLEDYRVLIIDHETGHRLGFVDNPTCPGAGQPAYVMMQQSMDLKGCTFNIWPTTAELTQLKTML